MTILFYSLATLTILSALGVVLNRNPIYSVLHLILCFFTIAGHYLILQAPFLAAIHIIVYAGAIMVLFLFMLMLFNLNKETSLPNTLVFKCNATLITLTLTGVLITLAFLLKTTAAPHPVVVGTVSELGKLLFTQYAVPFELTAVLFLSAVIGVVMIGKK